MRKQANNITAFLNFILDNKKIFNIQSFSDLTFSHGTEFLNHLAINKKIAYKSIKLYARTLTKFYEYLANKELLTNVNKYDFNKFKIIDAKNSIKETHTISPFDGVLYPSVSRNEILHDIRPEFITTFLNTAIYETPEIALGVYFQIFGGLRTGEAVNVSRKQITLVGAYGSHGMSIKLQEQFLRKDIKDSSGSSQVKKDRIQVIFKFADYLPKIYERHLLKYPSSIYKDVLFVNKNGKPMTGNNYRYYFEKLKKAFIKNLKAMNDAEITSYAIYIEHKKWSTHIGRGIFSNILASYSNNPVEVAKGRGDDNLGSSLSYVYNSEHMRDKINNELQLMYDKLKSKGYISNE